MKILFCWFTIMMLCMQTQTQPYGKFIDSFAKANNFNGTILIQEKNKISYQKNFGLADFQFKVANTIDTKYKAASITKFTVSTRRIIVS